MPTDVSFSKLTYEQGEIAQLCAPHGSSDVQGWNETRKGHIDCPYLVGRQFLMGIHRVLGSESVSAALIELYERGGVTGPSTEDEIYETFLKHAQPTQRDDFRLCYHRLHGRPVPGYDPPEIGSSSEETRDVLEALYKATNGPAWRQSGNWLTDAPPNEWHGVRMECNGSVSLDLEANNLTGPIPGELGNLSNLVSLDLGRNQLTGSIPPELGNLTRLVTLDLGRNQLTGPIPSELGNLSNLDSLNLIGNSLTGEIPAELGELADTLTYLTVDGTSLTGCVPSSLAAVQSTNIFRLGLKTCEEP